MEPTQLLGLLGGVAEWHSLARLGATRTALNRAISTGSITRVRRGCFALTGANPVTVAEVAWRGYATCVTAARQRGLRVLFGDATIHLRVPSDRSQSGRNLATPPGITRHALPKGRSGMPNICEALDDAGDCLRREAQLVMIDAALQAGLMMPADLRNLRRGGQERIRWLARYADGRSESVLETLARVALVSARLPVESQVAIDGVGRVDLLIARRVIVELDGWEHHSTPSAFASDRRRDREAIARGYRVLRFTYSEVVGGPDLLVAAVRNALSAAPFPAEVTARACPGHVNQAMRDRGRPWL